MLVPTRTNRNSQRWPWPAAIRKVRKRLLESQGMAASPRESDKTVQNLQARQGRLRDGPEMDMRYGAFPAHASPSAGRNKLPRMPTPAKCARPSYGRFRRTTRAGTGAGGALMLWNMWVHVFSDRPQSRRRAPVAWLDWLDIFSRRPTRRSHKDRRR